MQAGYEDRVNRLVEETTSLRSTAVAIILFYTLSAYGYIVCANFFATKIWISKGFEEDLVFTCATLKILAGEPKRNTYQDGGRKR